MILEDEIKKLKDLVNKLIESTSKEINSLEYLSGSESIKKEKILTDTLNKLVKLTININKSLGNKEETNFLCEEDEEIIDQFYQSYNSKIKNEKGKANSRSNIKK
jgi:hypothetical protein